MRTYLRDNLAGARVIVVTLALRPVSADAFSLELMVHFEGRANPERAAAIADLALRDLPAAAAQLNLHVSEPLKKRHRVTLKLIVEAVSNPALLSYTRLSGIELHPSMAMLVDDAFNTDFALSFLAWAAVRDPRLWKPTKNVFASEGIDYEGEASKMFLTLDKYMATFSIDPSVLVDGWQTSVLSGSVPSDVPEALVLPNHLEGAVVTNADAALEAAHVALLSFTPDLASLPARLLREDKPGCARAVYLVVEGREPSECEKSFFPVLVSDEQEPTTTVGELVKLASSV